MCVWIKSRFLMIFNNEWMNECRVCFGTIGYFLQPETKNIHSCYTKIISTEKQTDFFFCFTQVENMAFFPIHFYLDEKKQNFLFQLMKCLMTMMMMMILSWFFLFCCCCCSIFFFCFFFMTDDDDEFFHNNLIYTICCCCCCCVIIFKW